MGQLNRSAVLARDGLSSCFVDREYRRSTLLCPVHLCFVGVYLVGDVGAFPRGVCAALDVHWIRMHNHFHPDLCTECLTFAFPPKLLGRYLFSNMDSEPRTRPSSAMKPPIGLIGSHGQQTMIIRTGWIEINVHQQR